tara:strand:+ start:542 stop:1027 length:486 start_codon:yes stop_codon:yes gene_type:complete
MNKMILIIFLAIGISVQSQTFGYNQDKDYKYVSLGSSYAKTPQTTDYTPNFILTIGARYNLIDISINYEYVKLSPDYHSYFAQVQIVPLDLHNYEFLLGAKYGRVLRDVTYFYSGFNGEIRAKFNWFILSLTGSYDYRGDLEIYNSSSWRFTSHFKIGYKF